MRYYVNDVIAHTIYTPTIKVSRAGLEDKLDKLHWIALKNERPIDIRNYFRTFVNSLPVS